MTVQLTCSWYRISAFVTLANLPSNSSILGRLVSTATNSTRTFNPDTTDLPRCVSCVNASLPPPHRPTLSQVLLGCSYTVAIDMWSLACVLVEMHTGFPLFSGDDQVDQLRKIMQLLGPPPDHMIDKYPSQKRDQLFTQSPHMPTLASSPSASPHSSPFSRRSSSKSASSSSSDRRRRWIPKDPHVPSKTLKQVLGSVSGGPSGRWAGQADHAPEDYATVYPEHV